MASEQDVVDSLDFNIVDTFNEGDINLLQALEGNDEPADPNGIQPIVTTVETTTKTEGRSIPAKTTTETTTVKVEKDPSQKLLDELEGRNGKEADDEDLDDILSKKGDNPAAGDDPNPDDGDNQFNLLSQDLFRLGIFTQMEGEEAGVAINTPEEFIERWNSEKQRAASDIIENFLGRFGEDYQHAFDAIFVKGANPKDYFTAYNSIQDFSQLDMTLLSNQELVVRHGLEKQGYEGEDIESEIQRLKDYGDLDKVATRIQKVVVKQQSEELKRIADEAAAKQVQKQQARDLYIRNVQGILQEKLKAKNFDGIPLTPKEAAEIQDFILVDRYRRPDGSTLSEFDKQLLELKNPENHAKKVKIALLMKLLDKDPTLSTIQKVGVTKETNELFAFAKKGVSGQKSSGGGKPALVGNFFKNL